MTNEQPATEVPGGTPVERPVVRPVPERACWCHTCRPVSMTPPEDMRMVLCPDCGNKRCPRANNHRHTCTGSNEPGQPGSAYTVEPGRIMSDAEGALWIAALKTHNSV